MKDHTYKLLKSKTTRIIVKCLNSSSNNHRREKKVLKAPSQVKLVLCHQDMENVLHIDLNLSHFSFKLLKLSMQRLNSFSHLSLQSLKLIIRILKSSNQLVCKTSEKIHHLTSNWCRSKERCYGRLCIS
jgi:hypothetical protein